MGSASSNSTTEAWPFADACRLHDYHYQLAPLEDHEAVFLQHPIDPLRMRI
jgi:hypothetical protein